MTGGACRWYSRPVSTETQGSANPGNGQGTSHVARLRVFFDRSQTKTGEVQMSRPLFAIVLATTFLAPALSLANECQTVADAYAALGKAPAYRQTVTMGGKPLAELIVVGDTIYNKSKKGWTAMDVGAGGRVAMQKKALPDAASLRDCARVGPDTFAGTDAVMYDYTPPAVEGLGELGPQRVWIGTADGLPHRMTSVQSKTDVSLSFDSVTAPTP